MLVHTHIPKTGGTTLNHLLKTAYGWGFRQIRPSVDPWAHADLVPNVGNVQHLDEIKLRAVDKCLSSHWLFVEDAPATYILCYRDPIKRMVSDYAHKAELLGGLPDIDAFLRPRLPLQSDFMSGIVGVERFKDMVRDGRVIAVRTESLNDDLAALGAFGFGHRKNTAKGRRFYEEAKEIVHKNVSTEDIVQDIEIVRWLDENRQQAFRPLIPRPKRGSVLPCGSAAAAAAVKWNPSDERPPSPGQHEGSHHRYQPIDARRRVGRAKCQTGDAS